MNIIERIKQWMVGEPVEMMAGPLTDPAWWNLGGDAVSGESVSSESAMKLSTVYACVGLLAETIASLPLVVYRLDSAGARQRATNHPLYSLLHRQPNEGQTAFEFVQMMQTHALLRGSGYAEIVAGPRGFVDQLIPLHPDNVTKEKLIGSRRVRYRVRDDEGRERVLNQEDIFEVGGLTLDGWNTISVIQYARDSMGLGLAAERYGGRFFRNDSRPGGVLRTDGRLSKQAADRLKTGWESAHSGWNQNRVAVLEEGLQWQSIAIPPDQAQFLETREFQAEDVCRWFRVPPHMVGLTSKATTWGSGIEQMAIGFLTYTLRPWLTRWTQAVSRDLILAPDTYFADFIVEHLLRGDITSRYSAYATARQWGWLSVNEIRKMENMNPVDNGDVYLQPLNMDEAGQPQPPDGAMAHYRELAEEAAGRLARKEILFIRRSIERQAHSDTIREFYEAHAELVAQTMRISREAAELYCAHGFGEVITGGLERLADWPARRVRELTDIAIREG